MSHEHDSPEAELNTIEAALGSLAPARSQVNRDRLMFEAGRASVRPSTSGRRGWIAAAASLALIASGEGALLAIRPAPQVIERIVVIKEPAKPPVEPLPEIPEIPRPVPPSTESLLGFDPGDHDRLAGQLIRYGLDGLPTSNSPARGESAPIPITSRLLLQQELNKVLDPGDSS